ncbi:hypothetical protein BDB00DRAFT_930307 [Zychaea mexicana]|uniref:uncharacterized protein n=1 Tax=Zychaea mexicana TaxID=64656 RepID=UPI0022FECC7E|nr:uncharacterized protein BDB00DRAFT_930307 [Zychaea mexicana]KAI9491739.1 hypothetical protein BDB00DRAFT_930307 [Zychaea mexicana]
MCSICDENSGTERCLWPQSVPKSTLYPHLHFMSSKPVSNKRSNMSSLYDLDLGWPSTKIHVQTIADRCTKHICKLWLHRDGKFEIGNQVVQGETAGEIPDRNRHKRGLKPITAVNNRSGLFQRSTNFLNVSVVFLGTFAVASAPRRRARSPSVAILNDRVPPWTITSVSVVAWTCRTLRSMVGLSDSPEITLEELTEKGIDGKGIGIGAIPEGLPEGLLEGLAV